MKTSASNRRLRSLLTGIHSGTLIPQPDFQRRLVWSNNDKNEFIKTVLEGYPFPEIYIAAGEINSETGEGVELLVDGQQRITALNEYFRGATSLRLNDIPSYTDLTPDQKRDFLEYEVVVRDLGNIPIEDIKTIFQKINSTSYGLNAMEIHNARYAGEFKKFGEKISAKDFFEKHRVFTSIEIKRMKDVSYCLTLVSTILSTYFDREQEIEIFLEKYNECFPEAQEIENNLDYIFNFIDELSETSNRVTKKADLFTLTVELYYFLFYQGKIDTFNRDKCFQLLSNFYSEVEKKGTSIVSDANEYYNVVLQGSSNRSNRILRGKKIRNLLEEC